MTTVLDFIKEIRELCEEEGVEVPDYLHPHYGWYDYDEEEYECQYYPEGHELRNEAGVAYSRYLDKMVDGLHEEWSVDALDMITEFPTPLSCFKLVDRYITILNRFKEAAAAVNYGMPDGG